MDPVAPTLSVADKKGPSEDISRYIQPVKHFVDLTFNRGHFNGDILVAKNGEVIYEQYSGFRDPRHRKDSLTPGTPIHLASVSKTFTGMGVLKLWEEGRLNIDDSVSHYLPGFPCEGVTVRMLLNHRSGIPKYDHYMELLGWDKKKFVTNQDVLNFLIARHEDIPIGAPNKHFSYSNTNYALLALIIEKVTHTSYANFMKTTFFDPLNMKDTYVFTMADSARYLPSYYYSGRPYRFEFLDQVYGDKNIYSTARDLLKWDQALRSNILFRKQTLDAAYAPYSNEKRGIRNYGLAWRMYVLKNGKKLIYHNGWWHGNRTAFCRLMDEDVTMIALSNNDYKPVYSIRKMADIFGNYFGGSDAGDDDNENENVVVVHHHHKRPVHGKHHLASFGHSKKKSKGNGALSKK